MKLEGIGWLWRDDGQRVAAVSYSLVPGSIARSIWTAADVETRPYTVEMVITARFYPYDGCLAILETEDGRRLRMLIQSRSTSDTLTAIGMPLPA